MPTRKGGPRVPRRRLEPAEQPVGAENIAALSSGGYGPATPDEALGAPAISPADETAPAATMPSGVEAAPAMGAPPGAEAAPAPAPAPAASAPAEAAPGPAPAAPARTEAAAAAGEASVSTAGVPRRNPLFPLGVSLYPLDDESASFADAYARDLAPDLASLQEAEFGLVRLFVPWKLLEPAVGRYDTDALQRFADLVRSAREHRLQTIVCFFADDRHSDLTEVAWATKRDPRTDAYLIQREISLVAQVVGKLRADAGVFAWQLGNEAFLSGFSEKSDLDEWTMLLREAIRELDPKRPIGLGLDAETFFRQTGLDARDAVATCEFAVTHVTAAYHAYAAEGPVTSGPSTYLDAFLARLANRGVPVLLDDVGPLSLDTSPAEEAAVLRNSLWSALTNRAAGVLMRRFRDMSTERREPYFLDPFETLVGLADSDGELKPAFAEARRFIRTAARLDLRHLTATPERTAIVMPRERFNPLPDLAQLFDPRACLAAFVGAKEAHLPVAVAHETDDLTRYSVLIVPSAFNLADSTWIKLAAFVQSGGSLLLSYGGGDAHPAIRELFGVEFRGDGGPRETLSCRVAQDDMLGDLASFDAKFAVSNFAQLSAGRATVVATDATGCPLLTVNQVGQGRAVYVATPIERAIAQGDPWATPAPIRRMLREVYGAIARSAGCGAPVGCDAPEVEVALYQGVADDVLVLVNHSPRKVATTLTADRRVVSLSDIRSDSSIAVGSATFGVSIDANGVLALRLSYV